MVNTRVLVGSYSVPSPWAGTPAGHGAGIYALDADANGIALDSVAHFEVNPSFLVQDQRHGRVWAVSELEHTGELMCFDLDETGRVVDPPLRRVSTESAAPCHVELSERFALVSHYHGGVVSVIPLDEDGLPTHVVELICAPTAGESWERAGKASRPHSTKWIPGSDSFVVADYGRDLVMLYLLNQAADNVELVDTLVLELGTGPRHLAWHERFGLLYVSNQESGGITAVAVVRDAAGLPAGLTLAQTIGGAGLERHKPVPSEVAIHPAGNHVVLANRFDDSLTIYRVGEGGELSEASTVDSGGHNPRHFAFSPDGDLLLVAHQDSDELVAFRWSGGSCVLTARIDIATPTSVLFLNRMEGTRPQPQQ